MRRRASRACSTAIPHTLALDAEAVFFTNELGGSGEPAAGSIAKVPLGGGAAVTLASNVFVPHTIDLDAEHVYWATYDLANGMVARVSKGGGPAQVLASGLSYPAAIAVHPTGVFVVTSGMPPL